MEKKKEKPKKNGISNCICLVMREIMEQLGKTLYTYISNNNNYCLSCFVLHLYQSKTACPSRSYLLLFFCSRPISAFVWSLWTVPPHFVNNGLIFHISLFSSTILHRHPRTRQCVRLRYILYLMFHGSFAAISAGNRPQKSKKQSKFRQANIETLKYNRDKIKNLCHKYTLSTF